MEMVDRTVSGARSAAYGIGVVQRFDQINLDGYLGLRNYSLSEPAQAYLDSSSLYFGARWKF